MAAPIINLSSLDGNNGFRLDGAARDDWSGRSVSNAGDVNGDGFDDLIVGAPLTDPNNRAGSGSSYVVFGKESDFSPAINLSSLNGSNGFRVDGVAADDRLGQSVSNAGDVNGDGIDDLIIGAQNADPNGSNSGSSYVVFGKDTGFSATLDLASLDGNTGFRLDGEASGDRSGISVSSAGDINGDGYDDLIIGASKPYANYSPSDPITVSYLVFGKTSGFSSTLSLSNLDGGNGFYFYFDVDETPSNVAQSRSASNAGDVNGDGYDDLILGIHFPSSYHDANEGNASYVVFGKSSGFDSAFNLNSLDGSNGFRLDGAESDLYDSSGLSVNSAGDVNGDGLDDLIVGARTESRDFYQGGASYVVFGKTSGFGVALDLSSLDGSDGFRLRGGTYFEYVGTSVSGAGDVNGDGFDDLIVGAPSAQNASGSTSGTSYVVYGRASGFSATLDLPSLDGNNGFRLDGVAAGDGSGASVSGAGDVNGDGFADLIVGSYQADPNGSNSGSSYVVFGHSNFSEKIILGTPGNDNLTGTSAAEIFEAGDGNDNMIGRGGADVFHGGGGNDNIRVSDLDFQLIDGGTGNDVLHLTGKDLNLDLTNLGDTISGIETICLYGTGDNSLTLTAAELLNLSDTTNTLRVNGNAGDHIVGLSSGWTDGGIRGNGYFHAYTQEDAVLLVGINVTTDFV